MKRILELIQQNNMMLLAVVAVISFVSVAAVFVGSEPLVFWGSATSYRFL